MGKKQIGICATLFGLVFVAAATTARAQTLCGITKIANNGSEGEFKISFDGRKNLKVSAAGEDGGLVLDLRGRLTSNSSKLPSDVQAKRGDSIYVADGAGQSCVITQMERDGQPVFYIEEHFHVTGKPPRLLTEYIDAR